MILAFNICACATSIAHVAFEDFLESNPYQTSRLSQAVFFNIESINHLAMFVAVINGTILPTRSGFGSFESIAAVSFGVIFFVVQNVYVSSHVNAWIAHARVLEDPDTAELYEFEEEGDQQGLHPLGRTGTERHGAVQQAYPGNPCIAFVAIAQQLFPFNIAVSTLILGPTLAAIWLRRCDFVQVDSGEVLDELEIDDDVEKSRQSRGLNGTEQGSPLAVQETILPKNNLTKLEVGIYILSFGINVFVFLLDSCKPDKRSCRCCLCFWAYVWNPVAFYRLVSLQKLYY